MGLENGGRQMEGAGHHLWEPAFGQIAERANSLWVLDGCRGGSEIEYWMRAKQQLIDEYYAAAQTATHVPEGMRRR